MSGQISVFFKQILEILENSRKKWFLQKVCKAREKNTFQSISTKLAKTYHLDQNICTRIDFETFRKLIPFWPKKLPKYWFLFVYK